MLGGLTEDHEDNKDDYFDNENTWDKLFESSNALKIILSKTLEL